MKFVLLFVGDEAEEIAKKWPAGPVEIWPTVEN
jgi:hypothetical protein